MLVAAGIGRGDEAASRPVQHLVAVKHLSSIRSATRLLPIKFQFKETKKHQLKPDIRDLSQTLEFFKYLT
jgi:hypothetical protein